MESIRKSWSWLKSNTTKMLCPVSLFKKFRNRQRCYFMEIPLKVRNTIYDKLDPQDALNLRLVSRECKKEIDTNYVFKIKFPKQKFQNMERKLNSKKVSSFHLGVPCMGSSLLVPLLQTRNEVREWIKIMLCPSETVPIHVKNLDLSHGGSVEMNLSKNRTRLGSDVGLFTILIPEPVSLKALISCMKFPYFIFYYTQKLPNYEKIRMDLNDIHDIELDYNRYIHLYVAKVPSDPDNITGYRSDDYVLGLTFYESSRNI